MRDEQVGDGRRLLDRHQMGGAGHDGEAGVGNAGDQGACLGGPGDLVLRPDEHQRGHSDTAQFGPYVERGERLAGGDVAAGVRGADHLYGPLGDRGLGGGEPAGEPAVGRGAGDRVESVGPHDHPALPELVGGAEPGRGGDQHQRRQPLGVTQRQLHPDGPAQRTARVAEPLHTERVERGEQPGGELGDGPGRVRGRPAVPRQIEPQHTPLPGQLRDLTVPHVPCGTEGRPQDQDW
ncbi:hypothetical protein GCM10020256_10100 [Streptomyces thermocoprophilus]